MASSRAIGVSMTAGNGRFEARARPQSTEMAKICFSPSESRSLDRALPRAVVQGDREVRRVDQDPLDQRLLPQQEPERLGDQPREPVDLALGRPPQEVLHRRPRPRRELDDPGPVLLGELLRDITLEELRQLVLALLLLAFEGGNLRIKVLRLALKPENAARSRP